MNRRLLFLTAGAGLLVGCTTPPSDALDSLDQLPQAPALSTTTTTEVQESTTTSPTRGECEARDWKTASYRPAAEPEAGFLDALRARGYLLVGIDENTLGWAYRNRDGEFEGFEVSLAHEIAQRLFDDYDPERSVVFVPVLTDEKRSFVRNGTVDMTINANTMSCERWEEVAFSTEYYTAVQQLLVRSDSTIESLADLADKEICVTRMSSSIEILAEVAPDAGQVQLPARTDCLVALQEGEVDAYFGHDSFLYGMEVQDANVEIRADVIPADEATSHYGIAIAHDHPELVRFVNGVLEEVRAEDEWAELTRPLREDLRIEPNSPPPPSYRD